MKDCLAIAGETLKNFTLFIFEYCNQFAIDIFDTSIIIAKVILIFSIPYTFFYIEKKITKSLLLSKAQKYARQSLSLYIVIVSFPLVIFIISYLVDYVILFFKTFDSITLLVAIYIIAYIVMLYKHLYMLISFKKNALYVTHIFLITLPFVFVCLEQMRVPFYGLLQKSLPSPTNDLIFFGICLFSIPYLLFFTFSKRIKAAWADTPPLPKEACADPQ